jgi:ketosteroid isomerase-like protein
MTMKSAVSSLFLASLLAGIVVAACVKALPAPEKASDANRAAILAVLTAQQSDWNKANIRGFMEGYWNSSELTFAGAGGFTRGWQPVMTRYKKSYADKTAMGALDFSELEIRQLGPDAALALGKWHLQRQAGDVGGIFTLIFQKFPEGWRIIHDHTTQSPPKTKQ